MYKALDISAEANQIAYYDDGVGTSTFAPMKILGLVFGLGLASNVKSIYSFISRSYQPGDKIYGFGFSRGAFTMRVVMALISNQGLIKTDGIDEREFSNRVEQAYGNFRKKSFHRSLLSFIPAKIHHCFFYKKIPDNKVDKPDIEMLGVWDTVDAYGLPIDELRSAWDYIIYPLTARDRNCAEKVNHAYHALALDEQRLSFAPILWNERHDTPVPDQTVTQVWFSGVHADIGGGYPNPSLSLIPLLWMISNAKTHGLKFDDEQVSQYTKAADINGPMHDSRSSTGFAYRFEPRHVESLCRDRIVHNSNDIFSRMLNLGKKLINSENEVFIDTPKVHESVLRRLTSDSNNYGPINLPEQFHVTDNMNVVTDSKSSKTESFRRNAQGKLWNIVAARKAIYVINVVLLLTAAFLFITDYTASDPDASIATANLGTSFINYLKDNTNFSFLLGVVAGLLLLGGKLKKFPAQ